MFYLYGDRRRLRAIIRDSDKPFPGLVLRDLSKEDRRAYALELLERDREAYELRRQEEVHEEIKRFNAREMEKLVKKMQKLAAAGMIAAALLTGCSTQIGPGQTAVKVDDFAM